MKLSEAIRIGAQQHPQCFGRLMRKDNLDNEKVTATCAMGAAAVAYDLEHPAMRIVRANHHALLRSPSECPVDACFFGVGTVGDVILTLNDDHKWTREQIADWVETIEAQV